MMTGRLETGLFCLVAALSVPSCSSSHSSESTGPSTTTTNGADPTASVVEFVNNLQEPGAAQGLQAVIDIHRRRYPNIQFVNTTLAFNEYVAVPNRVAAGDPPDVVAWQANDLASMQPLFPLNDFLGSPSQADIASNVYPELIEESTVNNEVVALPWIVYRGNTLVYNKQVFNAHSLPPPASISEFRAACAALKAAGVTPVGGFGLTGVLGNMLSAVLGSEDFCSFVRGGTTNQTCLRQAIDLFAEIFDNDYYARDTLFFAGNPASAESEALMSGKVGMLFTVDWIQAPLQERGWTPGVDFGLLPAPGTAGLFTFITLALVVPRDAPHRQAALDFLNTAGSLDGHNAFYRSNLGSSTRRDVDMSIFDVERRGFIADMKGATSRCPVKASWRNWELPLVQLTENTPVDREAVLQLILTYP